MSADNQPEIDLSEHQRAFNGLMKAMVIVVVIVAVVLVFLAITQT